MSPTPETSRIPHRLDRRAAAVLVAVIRSPWSCRRAAADGPAIEGIYVPDVDRRLGNGDVEVPWKALSVTGLVIAFVGAAATVVFLTGRISERRRRSPPRSILEDGRR